MNLIYLLLTDNIYSAPQCDVIHHVNRETHLPSCRKLDYKCRYNYSATVNVYYTLQVPPRKKNLVVIVRQGIYVIDTD